MSCQTGSVWAPTAVHQESGREVSGVLAAMAEDSTTPAKACGDEQAGRQAGMIGFTTLQQTVPSQMTWQDSNTSRKHQ